MTLNAERPGAANAGPSETLIQPKEPMDSTTDLAAVAEAIEGVLANGPASYDALVSAISDRFGERLWTDADEAEFWDQDFTEDEITRYRAGIALLDAVNAGYVVTLDGGETFALADRVDVEDAVWRLLVALSGWTQQPLTSSTTDPVEAEEAPMTAAPVAPAAISLCMADVKPKRLEWLWPGRIPFGKLGVFDGDPGLGKSTVTIDLAARITTGRPLPGEDGRRTPAAVLFITAEDDPEDTIAPRLIAAGADMTRVHLLNTIPTADGRRPIEIPTDVDLIEAEMRRTGAVLLVMDPLMAYLPSGSNSWKDQDVRKALLPVQAMAQRLGAAVLLVRHLTKGSGGSNPLYRGGGSIGIIGAARFGWVVAKDPDDETRRVLAGTKSNLGGEMPSLTYRVVTAQVSFDGDVWDVGRIEWLGASEHSAEDLLAAGDEAPARKTAEERLREWLKKGPRPAAEIEDLASKAGIAESTLRRAKKKLGVESYKVGLPGTTNQCWFWRLPVEGDHAATA